MSEVPVPPERHSRWPALALVFYSLCAFALGVGWQVNFPWSLHDFVRSDEDVGWGATLSYALLAAIGLFCARRSWSGRVDSQAALVGLAWLVLLALTVYFAAPWLWAMNGLGV